MSLYDSDFSGEENLGFEKTNIEQEIIKCKKSIDDGRIYNSIEYIEDVLQLCIESDKNEDGFYFS